MIPTFNQAHFLDEAISSALMQNYPNLEVVVSDDASTDPTPEVVKKYKRDERFFYFRNKRNIGRVNNYKKTLFTNATGKWVLTLDGDDYLTDSHFIKDAVEKIKENGSVVLVIGGQRYLENDGGVLDSIPTNKEWKLCDGFDFFLQWKINACVPHLASIYNREFALKLKFYELNIISSDWESLRRLVLHGSVLLCGRVVGVWRGHGINISKGLDINSNIENILSFLNPYEYALKMNFNKLKLDKWKKSVFLEYIEKYISRCVGEGQFTNATKYMTVIKEKYPEIYPNAIKKVIFSHKVLGKFLLFIFGGRKLVSIFRTWWWKRINLT